MKIDSLLQSEGWSFTSKRLLPFERSLAWENVLSYTERSLGAGG